MKGKSLLAALLSAMMIFGTAVPAFADNTEAGKNEAQEQEYELYGTPDYEAPVLIGMSADKTETEPYVVDTQAPKLNKILLSKTEVQAGETIIVNVEGTDDISGIDDWDAYFESDSGETLATTTVSDGITKTIEIEVSEYKPSGVYHLVSASVWDKAGNSRDYFANPTGNQEKLPHNLSITVNNSAEKEDTQAPKLNKILLSKTEVQAGETIIVNVEGTDDISGIDDWDAYFESDSGETLATTTVSDGITKTIEIEVSEYKPSGVYHLVSASVWDKAGNSRDYFANPTGNQEKLPHNLSITVNNSAEKEDTQAPKLNKILLSKTEVQAGETIIVNVEGTDDISGIDDWDAYFESDSGETLATTTVSDGITKTIEIEVSEYKPSGVYHLVSASVWDKAGNSRDYFANPTGNQEKLPHNLSITVINDDVSIPNTDSDNHTGNSSSNHSGVVNYESEKPNQNDKKAVEAYNFWQNVKNKIHKAEKGKIIKVFVPKEITNMPASVMETLRRENVGMTIKQNGKTITIPAGKAQPKQKLKAYWTFKTLDRLY